MNTDDREFFGKVAFVTGAGAGIGQASARAFARVGAKVMVADINRAAANATCELINAAGGQACAIELDVRDAAAVRDAIAKTLDTYGRLDYAHNNAGINGALGTVAEYAEQEWDRVLDTDLKGVWLCMKYQIPALLSVGGGAIVNTGSAFGLIAAPEMPAYSAAKHGLIGLTKSAALCYARQNIRINSVNPGSVRTPMFSEVWGADVARAEALMADIHPIGRISEPEEIAQAVLWLCSTRSAFVVGHSLMLDGGLCAGLVKRSA